MKQLIAVAGAGGFIGSHMVRAIDAHAKFEARPLGRAAFASAEAMCKACRSCRTVVMLAGISRSDDPEAMYRENMRLAEVLAHGVGLTGEPIRVLWGSTTHEAKETPYHRSKRDGGRLLAAEAVRFGFETVQVLMPNTFGAGGKPFYNSVVSTFCQLAATGQSMTVTPGAGVTHLIYVDTLVEELFRIAVADAVPPKIIVKDEFEVEVSRIAELLTGFAVGKSANCENRFEKALFKTYESYKDAVKLR